MNPSVECSWNDGGGEELGLVVKIIQQLNWLQSDQLIPCRQRSFYSETSSRSATHYIACSSPL